MAREKEIKLSLNIPLEVFLDKIVHSGYQKVHELQQLDIYYDTKDWYLYENIAALRLRQVNGKDESFSFKKVFYTPAKSDKYYVEEIEVKSPFDNTTDLSDIFSRIKVNTDIRLLHSVTDFTTALHDAGYFDEQKMPKKREVYIKDDTEIVIDDVDKVGVIIELECHDTEPLDIVKNFLADAEWTRSVEGTSYIWLKNVFGLTSHIENFKRFASTPDWNVWDNEREMYAAISG